MKGLFKITIVRLLLALFLLTPICVWGQWHIPVIGGFQPNDAMNLGNDCFTITSTANTLGVVWDSNAIDLGQPFDITLSVNQLKAGFAGGDGIALVLQGVGLSAFGAGGNALAFGNSLPVTPGYPPIVPSMAFEVDTWNNFGSGVADIAAHHVAIHRNGDMTTTIGAPVSALASGLDVNDGLCHQLRVIWTPGPNAIQVYFDGVQRINLNYNMVGLTFGGNPIVWWGITGSSGGAGMLQQVCVGANFAQVGADRAVCAGDTLHLAATGGISYAWLPLPLLNNPAVANPIFGPAAAGTYTVSTQATNLVGCTDRDTTLITVEALPVSNPGGPLSLCVADSVQIGGVGNPAYSYEWSPNLSMSDSTLAQPWVQPPLGSLVYTLIVTDTTGLVGCKDTASVTVTTVDTPSVAMAAVNDTICQGTTSLLSAVAAGGTGPYGYVWDNLVVTNTQTVMPLVATSYAVTVTDFNGCLTSGTLAIVVNDTPVVAATALPDSICAGQYSALNAAVAGVLPFVYNWTSGAILPNDTVYPLATTSYAVTVTDLKNCQGRGNVVVTVNVSDSIAVMTPDTLACLGDSIAVLNTFATAGIDTWNWIPATGVSNTGIPNPVIGPVASTTYYLQAINSTTGCGYTDSLVIDYVPLGPPVVDLGADAAICMGDSLALDAGNPGFSFAWLDGSTTQQVVAFSPGWYAVTVVDTFGCGYVAGDSLNLVVNPIPQPFIGNDTLICEGDSIGLTDGAATGTLLWSNGSTAPAVTVSQAGFHWLQVTDGIGCAGRDSLLLQLQALPNVQFGLLLPEYCLSDTATVLVGTPSGGSFSGAVGGGGLFDPVAAGVGSHVVGYTYTDGFGCAASDVRSTVVVAPPSPALAGPDLTGEAQLQLQGILPAVGTGQWTCPGFTGSLSDPFDPQAIVTQDVAGTYLLIWTVAEAPCPSNRDSVYLTFEGVHIPTGFSPNADGVNDAYFIRGIGGYANPRLRVFNRWGQLVWASDNYQNDWNGENSMAQPLVDDTYFAVIEYDGKSVNTYIVLKRD